MSKYCPRCRETKPETDFSKNRSKPDGLQGYCRKCGNVYGLAYTRTPQRKASLAAYARTSAGKLTRSVYQHTPEGKASIAASNKKRRLADPLKYTAHSVVTHALRDGKITKLPCQVCGALKVEGHHPDYSKPLEVIWLCRQHHVAEHRRLIAGIPPEASWLSS